MKVDFKRSFLKDINNLKNQKLKKSILAVIQEVEGAAQISAISNLKKLKGFTRFYRIRVGDYRIGIELKNNTLVFVAFDNRKEIYRKFP